MHLTGGSTSGTLFEVTVPTMTNTECNTKYGGSITDNMICAGIPEGGKDSCQVCSSFLLLRIQFQLVFFDI